MNEDLRGRLLAGSVALLVIGVVGTTGYYWIGGGRWSVIDCMYMVIITLTTVGFGEILSDFEKVAYARWFTMGLITAGVGSFVYFASTITAIIIEGHLRLALRKTRMRNDIAKLTDHIVVCGCGTTGRHVLEELLATGMPAVAIDVDNEALTSAAQEMQPRGRLLYIVGDATEDSILEAANVDRARGMVAALHSDKDNLFLVVSARHLNPTMRIVARGAELSVLSKLRRAGADTVVSPNYIGGMRMVSEMVRPHVVRFLDEMMNEGEDPTRIDEVEIPSQSPAIDETLQSLDIRKRTNLNVLAVHEPSSRGYDYAPSPDLKIRAGMTLVVLGQANNVALLREMVRET